MKENNQITNEVLESSMQDEFYFQWHITERCNWRCKHCYHEGYKATGELTCDELLQILDIMEKTLRGWEKKAAVSITGGEPWLRKNEVKIILERMEKSDVFTRADLLTNGSLLDDDDCKMLASFSVLRRIQVSLEGAYPETNDKIRGEGAFNTTIESIRRMKKHGLEVSVMMTIAQYNYEEVIPLLEVLNKEQVDAFALERFMPEGQSRKQKDQVLTSEQVKQTFSAVHQWALKNTVPRVLQYRPLFCLLANNDPYVGAMCSVGENALTILHDGTILPCRRLPIPLGNILTDNLFEIWAESPFLWKVRMPSGLKGKCAHCDHIVQCRGCRAMAYSVTGDWLAPDPHCWYSVMVKNKGPRLADDIRLVWPQHSDIRFAYSLETGKTVELNETSYAALQLFNGQRSIKDVANELSDDPNIVKELEKDINSLCVYLRGIGFLR
jgi:radical SAM protein with 4Fe4S-binding SPASM domain